ncbi:MAG: hypothetical protein DRI36_01215 [Caldiserica bacterium]|nr:MAG: hypothetical protein DRI36_01215 [Caldisericota bacterium]
MDEKDLIFDVLREKNWKKEERKGKFGFFVKGNYIKSYTKFPKKELIGEKEVKDWIMKGKRRVVVKRGTIITPLAWELIKEKNIEVKFD